MFEKVNIYHPDKVADRIAGAIVDEVYRVAYDPESPYDTDCGFRPSCAVEVLIGHGVCTIINETNIDIPSDTVGNIVRRITGENHIKVSYTQVDQDEDLKRNQQHSSPRCGDNGIFRGVPISVEEARLTAIAQILSRHFKSDGKYIINDDKMIICQSHSDVIDITDIVGEDGVTINPLGYWDGGTNVDCGATNRKLGSDMGRAVTGGGLHGKDLSKADVSVNIYCHLKAQQLGHPVEMCCAIGDTEIDGIPYSEIVKVAESYIKKIGGFEKLAEWGLIR